jgi:hypothetical protein
MGHSYTLQMLLHPQPILPASCSSAYAPLPLLTPLLLLLLLLLPVLRLLHSSTDLSVPWLVAAWNNSTGSILRPLRSAPPLRQLLPQSNERARSL